MTRLSTRQARVLVLAGWVREATAGLAVEPDFGLPLHFLPPVRLGLWYSIPSICAVAAYKAVK
jgi:hypothetical protein